MDKATGFVLNRKKYQVIKRYDHNQMTTFLAELYREGYANGRKAAEGLTKDEMKEVLLQVKGIGEKKTADIIAAIENRIKEKNSIEKNKKAFKNVQV